jgi:hypothetical protein
MGLGYRIGNELPQNLGSDHFAFVQNGVPSIIFNCFCDPNYHTSEDKFDFIQEARLGQAGNIGMGMLAELVPS